MSIPTQEEIFARFPVLFSQKDLSIQESCMAWGLSHGEGWNPIIVELCEKIEAYLKEKEEEGYTLVPVGEDVPKGVEKYIYQVEFAQIKSKWYRLRVYIIGGDDTIHRFIAEAETKSGEICEGCGKDFPEDSEERMEGWTHSYCEPCRTKKREG